MTSGLSASGKTWACSQTPTSSRNAVPPRPSRALDLTVQAQVQRRVKDVPESGLPIRVYKEHDMWHVDYGEGVIEDHTSEEEAMSAAEAVAQADERTVVVEE